MKKGEKERDLWGFLKNLGDISTYTAAIVTYLLAISGKAPTPYPHTVSFLTSLVTVIAVWLWRWPRIAANLTTEESSLKSRTEKKRPEKISKNRRQRPPIKEASGKPSFLQNRLEFTVLSALTVGIVALGGFKLPSMREEVTGLNCLNAPGKWRVMITNLTFSPEQQFENDLGNALARQTQGLFQVCRYLRDVDFIDEIYLLREQYDMDLILWGSYSDANYKIEFTASPDFTYSRADGMPVENTDEQIAFLTAETIATLSFIEGDFPTAQDQLQDALAVAEAQGWADTNPTLLADGYSLMGEILSANPWEEASALDAPIQAYSKAIRTDPGFERAYWNQAELYLDQGKVENARDNYEALIQLDAKYAIDARWMKAQVSLEQGDCPVATTEIEEALQMPKVDETHELFPDLMYILGKARLLCKDYLGAQQAFENIPPLSEEFAPVFLDDLNAMAGASEDPVLKEEIQKNISLLQQKIIH